MGGLHSQLEVLLVSLSRVTGALLVMDATQHDRRFALSQDLSGGLARFYTWHLGEIKTIEEEHQALERLVMQFTDAKRNHGASVMPTPTP